MRLRHRTARAARQIVLVGLTVVCLLGTGVHPTARAKQVTAVEEIGRQTSQVRGLELLDGPAIEESSPATVQRLVYRDLESEARIRELRATERFLHQLGLLPDDLDLRRSMMTTLGGPVPALYVPDGRQLYLALESAVPSADEKLALAHELVHFLQDQNFGLLRRLSERTVGADRVLAIRALVEGDAMVTMRLWGRQYLTPREKATLGPARTVESPWSDEPLWVQQRAMFPYREGRAFVEQLYRSGGFEAVNQVLRNPPESTEQVLHLERYVVGDRPRSVQIPSLSESLGSPWRVIQVGTLGELGYRILIEQYADRREAEDSAAGWGGDSYMVLEDDGGELVVVLSSVWDTEGDAAELFNAVGRGVTGRFGPGAWRTVDVPSLNRWAIPTGHVQVVKIEDRVHVVYAPTELDLDRAAAELS